VAFGRGILLAPILIFWNCHIPANADECYLITDKTVEIAKDFAPSSVLTFTLRKNKEARYILFIGKNQTQIENNVPWLLARRSSDDDPSRYCTEGKGNTFELLSALHNAPERFGLPGSGYPRCSEAGDVLGSLKVRAWASKELGGGSLTSFEADKIGFSLLTGEGAYWILLKSDRNKVQTCYFDRGDDFLAQEYNLRPQ
jgi:hypothetical protein